LAAAALPQFYPFKTRAYDADAKANLHNVYLSCKGYWALNQSNSPCVLSTVSNNEYGFIQSAAVEVAIGDNNNIETDFVASASHIWSVNSYAINFGGVITSVDSLGQNSSGSGSGSSGSGGGDLLEDNSGSGDSEGEEEETSEEEKSNPCEKLKGKKKRDCNKLEKKKERERKKKEKGQEVRSA